MNEHPAPRRRWDEHAYQRIVGASYDASDLVVRFADGTTARVDVSRMPRVQARHPTWPAVSANEFEVVVPTADGDFEVSWLAIRSLSDPEFNAHLTATADEEARRIGRRLTELRRHRGLSLAEAASRSGLTSEQLRCVERGEAGIQLVVLEAILVGLGHSFADIEMIGDEPSAAEPRNEVRVGS